MHLTSVQKREVFVEWARGMKSGDMFIVTGREAQGDEEAEVTKSSMHWI